MKLIPVGSSPVTSKPVCFKISKSIDGPVLMVVRIVGASVSVGRNVAPRSRREMKTAFADSFI